MTLSDDLERLLGEQFTDWQKELLRAGMIVEPNTEPILPAPITVQHVSGYFEVPRELLEQSIFDETTPRPPTAWYRRARWRWQAWRHMAGVKVGSWIAGFDLGNDDECE
jgi:hypothetical protein